MTAPPTDLRVEHDAEPLAAPPDPRFSWRVAGHDRGARQTAYRLLVARDPGTLADDRGDAWDSGWVESDRSIDVPYDGAPLQPDSRHYWKVRIRDGDGAETAWSDPAAFATAPEALEGEWIAHQPEPDANGWRSRWRAPGFTDEEAVTVDLGVETAIGAVELHPADPFDGPETPDGKTVSAIYAAADASEAAEGAAGFGFPEGYRIEVADDPDFADPTVVADRIGVENPGDEAVTHDCEATGRYVRVTATDLYEFDPFAPPDGHGPLKEGYVREAYGKWRCFALAALAVRDPAGEDRAPGGEVSVSSSVETDTWGRAFLADGRYESETTSTSPLLRTEFDLEKPVAEARAHVCGLGYGERHCNGDRVGETVLSPGWTQYDERAYYTTHDVTDRLREGRNAVGVWLGRGWFAKNSQSWTAFGSPRAILDLRIEYEDGTTRRVTSGGDWLAAASPVVENDVYDGERYDARLERPGWAERDFDDGDWDPAAVVAGPGGDLQPQRAEPMRVTETLDPDSIEERESGYLIDFGQNLTGWVELRITGASEGDEVTIRHAENLLADGSLNTIDLRSADATDEYVARGDDEEVYRPRFTYHGFRYAEVSGYPGDLERGDVAAQVVHSDVPRRGEFDCANDDLAQVQENATWGLRGNAHSIPEDCPQRDERMGWTGDGHISARAFAYNFDSRGFHEKWSEDHDDAQSAHGYVADTVPFGRGSIPEDPTWGITRVTVPWHLYRHYGDREVLERHYEGMRRYVAYWHSVSEDGVIPDEPGSYGDWLAFENTADDDERRGLPHDLFNTAFHYHTTSIVARIAEVLGNDADAEALWGMAENVREGFHEAFFDGERYGPGTQSSYAVPLFVGLVSEEHEEAVAAGLAEKVRADGGKLRTGFLGTRPLIHVLAAYGYEDLAYGVVSQPEKPGWVYMVRQGATTTWERWDSDSRVGDGMNSFNHSPFTFVSEWFYAELAGIDFAPSIAEGIEIDPAVVADLEWAEASIDTPKGEVASRWERAEGGLDLSIGVPWNATATVRIPAGEDREVREGGEPIAVGANAEDLPDGIESASRTGEEVAVEVGAGAYEFAVR